MKHGIELVSRTLSHDSWETYVRIPLLRQFLYHFIIMLLLFRKVISSLIGVSVVVETS